MKNHLARIAVFALTLGMALNAGAAEKETVVYNFGRRSPTGWAPNGKLVMDAAGNLYGTASEGGVSTQCCGVIFQLTPAAGGGWNYNKIYTFTGQGDGSFPVGSLVMDAAGNLYGTGDGQTASVYGEFFELSPNGSGGWTEKVLYALRDSNDVGPSSPLVMDAAGNLYGTNEGGGAQHAGYVFELSPGSGGEWTFQHLFDFNISDGLSPTGVILDAAGNLFGTTTSGGTGTICSDGCGLVFELTKQSGTWSESTLFEFDGSAGALPLAPPTLDAAGNLYGIAGTIAFELKKVAGIWQERVVHSFTGANGDGAIPNASLVLKGGNLYGTTAAGGIEHTTCQSHGTPGCGTAFVLSPSGGAWKETILLEFPGGNHGSDPYGLALDPSGNAFGVATASGVDNGGLVFELSPTK